MNRVYAFFTSSFLEYPDNESLAVVVSFSGCPHHCPGCHSPLAQIYKKPEALFYKGKGYRIQEEKYYYFDSVIVLVNLITDLLERNNTNKLVITGGDPFWDYNRDYTLQLIDLLPNTDICVYTGMTIDVVKGIIDEECFIQPKNIIYKCGTYKEELKQESLKTDDKMVLASTNQNFYNSNFEQISNNGILKFNNEVSK